MPGSIYHDIIAFVKRPETNPHVEPLTITNWLKILGGLIIFVIPYVFILHLADLSELDHKMQEMWDDNKVLIAFMAIFIGPFLEELMFRLHLRQSTQTIMVSLLLSLFIVFDLPIMATLYIAYLGLMLYRWRQEQPLPMPIVVYVSNAFFALVHLANFSNFDLSSHIIYIPLLVGAQFVIGFVFCFVRIHYGIWHAIILHGAYNASLIIPALLFEDSLLMLDPTY